ncbi:hypothetical protein FRC01_004887, partial [Tulasnella sp. 417]
MAIVQVIQANERKPLGLWDVEERHMESIEHLANTLMDGIQSLLSSLNNGKQLVVRNKESSMGTVGEGTNLLQMMWLWLNDPGRSFKSARGTPSKLMMDIDNHINKEIRASIMQEVESARVMPLQSRAKVDTKAMNLRKANTERSSSAYDPQSDFGQWLEQTCEKRRGGTRWCCNADNAWKKLGTSLNLLKQ